MDMKHKLFGIFGSDRRDSGRFEVEGFDPEKQTAIIRSSICTGEKVACMREKETGKLHELALIRSEEDLQHFCLDYGVEKSAIRTIY